ncbi:MAG: hypothetical protein OXR66_00315 [Candidatus Woesearchaeota archaeon]|nr:hypothetical protein [Candidatus Woesearchaeota archaeon]
MPRVLITEALFKEIGKKFSTTEAQTVVDLLENVATHPKKGKVLGSVGGVLIKEVKYMKFRFYCITDGHQLKFGSADELAALLMKFVAMSEKKNQQRTINRIKRVLRSLGFEGF